MKKEDELLSEIEDANILLLYSLNKYCHKMTMLFFEMLGV